MKRLDLSTLNLGQTGPYKDRPGFGVIGEAMGGLRHLSAQPGEIPCA